MTNARNYCTSRASGPSRGCRLRFRFFPQPVKVVPSASVRIKALPADGSARKAGELRMCSPKQNKGGGGFPAPPRLLPLPPRPQTKLVLVAQSRHRAAGRFRGIEGACDVLANHGVLNRAEAVHARASDSDWGRGGDVLASVDYGDSEHITALAFRQVV